MVAFGMQAGLFGMQAEVSAEVSMAIKQTPSARTPVKQRQSLLEDLCETDSLLKDPRQTESSLKDPRQTSSLLKGNGLVLERAISLNLERERLVSTWSAGVCVSWDFFCGFISGYACFLCLVFSCAAVFCCV